jgi:hypothetical protein
MNAGGLLQRVISNGQGEQNNDQANAEKIILRSAQAVSCPIQEHVSCWRKLSRTLTIY